MNILLLNRGEETSAGEFRIRRPQIINHINRILKKKSGDSVKAGLEDDSLGLFRIKSVSEEEIRGKFTAILRPRRRSPEVRAVVSVQRPPTVEKILHLAGVWGISNLCFVLAELSRKEYLTSPVWKGSDLYDNLRLGMEQGGNIHLPKTSLGFTIPEKGTQPSSFLTVNDLISDSSIKTEFYLDPNGIRLSDIPPEEDLQEGITIYLGPEPGWSNREKSLFRKKDIRPIRLSRSILRSEQAFSFFLAQWEAYMEANRS